MYIFRGDVVSYLFKQQLQYVVLMLIWISATLQKTFLQ